MRVSNESLEPLCLALRLDHPLDSRVSILQCKNVAIFVGDFIDCHINSEP